MMDHMSSAASSREDLSRMWRSQLVFWHLVFAVVWGTAIVIVLVEPPGRYGRGVEVACLLGVVLAYAVLALRGLVQNAVGWGTAYLVVAWGLVLTVQWLNPETQTWVLFFILFPQMWAMLGRRLASRGTFVVVGAFALIKWLTSDRSSGMAISIIVSSVISIGLSLALGLFIHRIITEAESRAETIDELRLAQDRLAAAERDRGVHEERERLSREIHDTLAQGFTSVLALARAADAALARDDVGTARERLALVESTAADNLREARLIVAELTPGHLQSRTLAEALDRLVTAVSTETSVRSRLVLNGEPVALGGATDVVLLRTAQEALSNVRRHSGAGTAVVELSYADPDRVVLEVSDDGRGFTPAEHRPGFGLDGLTARVAELGGAVSVTSAPGEGTRVRMEVPR